MSDEFEPESKYMFGNDKELEVIKNSLLKTTLELDEVKDALQIFAREITASAFDPESITQNIITQTNMLRSIIESVDLGYLSCKQCSQSLFQAGERVENSHPCYRGDCKHGLSGL